MHAAASAGHAQIHGRQHTSAGQECTYKTSQTSPSLPDPWLQAIQRLATHPKLAARVYAVPAGAHVGASQLTRMGSGASASSQVVPVPAGVRDQRFAQEQASEMAQLPLRVPAKGARGPLAMEPVVRPQ